jgi:predicted amidophosphoribosyltransferase
MPEPNKKEESNPLIELIRKIKIAYAIGKDPITSAMASRGFTPSKNAALNYGRLMNISYDPETRIRPRDPQQQLRANNMRIGETERLTNLYGGSRTKLAN